MSCSERGSCHAKPAGQSVSLPGMRAPRPRSRSSTLLGPSLVRGRSHRSGAGDADRGSGIGAPGSRARTIEPKEDGDQLTFDSLGLSADLVRMVAEEGYESP